MRSVEPITHLRPDGIRHELVRYAIWKFIASLTYPNHVSVMNIFAHLTTITCLMSWYIYAFIYTNYCNCRDWLASRRCSRQWLAGWIRLTAAWVLCSDTALCSPSVICDEQIGFVSRAWEWPRTNWEKILIISYLIFCWNEQNAMR
jgi:hypothetical protein